MGELGARKLEKLRCFSCLDLSWLWDWQKAKQSQVSASEKERVLSKQCLLLQVHMSALGVVGTCWSIDQTGIWKMDTYFDHCLFQKVVAVCDCPVLCLKWKKTLSRTKVKCFTFCFRNGKKGKQRYIFFCVTPW